MKVNIQMKNKNIKVKSTKTLQIERINTKEISDKLSWTNSLNNWTTNTKKYKPMNKHNLIQVNINLIDPTPAPSPSPSIDENYEEGIILTEEDRYNYELAYIVTGKQIGRAHV